METICPAISRHNGIGEGAPFAYAECMSDEILLRDVIDSDLDVFFGHQQEEAGVQMAAFTADDPSDRAAFDAHWEKIRAHEAIRIQTITIGDDEVVGHLASWPDGEGRRELTYWLGQGSWGRGIATAALARFVRDEERPVLARAAKDNLASIRVLEKCGFVHLADARGFANARGEEIDEVEMELAQGE